jgi:RNase H-like domain found in reverse transcriptase
MPNDQDTFLLDTDASDCSIGAVLSQIQNGQERVIAYAGRCLNRAEANYCITRRELLAVVYFIRHFRHFFLGKPFVLRTDHAALAWLNKTRDPIGQNA